MIRALPVYRRLNRARDCVALGAKYVLGAGGRRPHAVLPFTERNGKYGADCIGFTLWALGVDRYQPGTFTHYDGWMNTDSIIQDCQTQVGGGHWQFLTRPTPGCLVVYSSIWKDGKMTLMGHIGMVTKTPMEWAPKNACSPKEWGQQMRATQVADCAGSLARRLIGKAIGSRTAELWAPRGYFVDLVLPPAAE